MRQSQSRREGARHQQLQETKDRVSAGAKGSFSGPLLRCGTWNLRSSMTRRDILPSERRAVIRRLATSAGLAILGVQETNTECGTEHHEGWMTLASGRSTSKCARLGCELWLRLAAFGEGALAANSVRVTHADPRRLLAMLPLRGGRLTIAVLHSPTQAEHQSVLREWWSLTTEQLRRHDNLLVLIDSNGRVGPVPDRGGHFLQRFLDDLELQLPEQAGLPATWRNPRGGASRIDHVLFKGDLLMPTGQVDQHENPDPEGCFSDHSLTSWELRVAPTIRERLHWGVPRFHREAMQDPEKLQQFRTELLQLPVSPWSLDAQTHYSALTRRVSQVARRAFGPPIRKCRAYLSDCTVRIVLEARKLKKWLKCVARPPEERPDFLHDGGTDLFVSQLHELRRLDVDKEWQHAVGKVEDEWQCIHAQLVDHCELVPNTGGMAGALTRLTSTRIKKDKAKAISRLIDQVEQPVHRSGATAPKVLQILRRFTAPRVRRPLPMLQDPSGRAAETEKEAADALLRHFAEVERGEAMRLDQLKGLADTDEWQALFSNISWGNVPSKEDLTALFSARKRGKAADLNGMVDDLFRAAPCEMACLYHPLLTKIALVKDLPVEFRGALLAGIWKGRGRQDLPDSYRAIALGTITAKHFQAFLRRRLADVVKAYLHHNQQGGLKGRGVDVAAWTLSEWRGYAVSKGTSVAILFVDLATAFHRTLRSSLARTRDSAGELEVFSSELQQHPGGEAIVRELHSSPVAFDVAGLEPHLQSQLQRELTDTWVSMRGTGAVWKVRSGTRPGMPLADLLFNVAVRDRLSAIHSFLHSHSLSPTLDEPELAVLGFDPLPAFPSVFMDDVAVPICADSADTLPAAVASATAFMEEEMQKGGWSVNYHPLKTAALLQPKGKGSRKLQQRLHAAGALQLPGSATGLPITRQYKHLGSQLMRHAHPLPVVRDRERKHSAGLAHIQRVAKLGRAGPTDLWRLYKATAQAALFYNVAVFGNVSAAVLQRLDTALTRGLKVALSLQVPPGQHPPAAADLRLCLRSMDARLFLRVRRLALLPRLLRQEEPAIKALLMWGIASHTGWGGLLNGDLQALCPLIEPPPPAPAEAPGFWTDFALRPTWRALVARYQSSALAEQLDEQAHQQWLRRLRDIPVRPAVPGAPRLPTAEPPQPLNPRPYQCQWCKAACTSAKGLLVHRQRAHPEMDPHARRTYDTVCPACLKECHRFTALHWHWRQTRWCWQYVAEALPDAGPEHALAIREKRRKEEAANRGQGTHPHDAGAPLQRVPGPRPRLPEPSLDQPARPGRAAPPRPQPERHDVLRALGGGVIPTPRQLAPSSGRVVLSLFAGHRRERDIQWHFERSPRARGFIFLSLDIVNHAVYGDLTRLGTIGAIRDLIAQRHVVGIVLAPPCETWSAARHNPVPGAHAPRPLRSRACLWGLPRNTLTKREQLQVSLGSSFMRLSIEILRLAQAGGIPAVLEHPETALHVPAPSCWLLPEMQALSSLPGAQQHLIHQCTLGTPFRKPTRLGAVAFPQLAARIASEPTRCKCTHSSHDLSLIGRAPGQGFRTAQAKAYPDGLCQLLADALVEALPLGPPLAVPHAVQSFLDRAATPLDSSRSLGPDFAPHSLAGGQAFVVES